MRHWVVSRGLSRPFFTVVALGAVVVLVAGAGLAAFDSDVVGSYGEGVWWAIALATTAGFAGEAPTSTAGYVLSAGVMLIGFWLLTLTTAAIASLFVREEEEPAEGAEIALDVEILERLDELSERLARLERELKQRPER
jgi:voltage-gated potassium channel